MANNVILGSDLMLFKNNKALAAATNCKLTISANMLETSSKDSGCWTEKQGGKLNWTASSDNLFVISEVDDLFDALINRTQVSLQFSTVSNKADCSEVPSTGWTASSDGYTGTAIISSIDINAQDGENATYTVSFEGTGALEKVAE